MEVNMKKIVTFLIFFILVLISNKIYATESGTLKNTTRAYFCSEITKNYGNGDCILLENYDSNGNKIYGLIDAGRKINTNDENGNSTTVVKDFLEKHGVKKLEFLAITHSHGDHNGDALTVLDNFEVDTIYMKEFDEKWSPSGTQATYEHIIEKAIEKNIKVVGVSYLSLISNSISPSRSNEFVNSVKRAKRRLFESFYYNNNYENNIIFKFGSATIQIFNWEMFDDYGNQFITGVTNDSRREIDADENNNSITFLLKQGNKKAFFAGDMNNLDGEDSSGRVGDEDRIKHDIGEVDFLKLGHHGYRYSNTEDYINVLNPKYAVITNDIGGAYKDISKWLKEKNVNYLYTTSDEYGVSATIEENNVYLGFETTGSFKIIDDSMYYVPKGIQYKFADYKDILYKVEYKDKSVQAGSWNELKEVINNNKNEIVNVDDIKKICTLYRLVIELKNNGNWSATNSITIEKQQNVVLTATNDIRILRGEELINLPLFMVNGSVSLGTANMRGKIYVDGNKDNVESTSTLIKLELGTLNIYNNVTLCNNMNKTTQRTINSSTQDYTSFGSAIYSKSSKINMYGGSISNNLQDVDLTNILPKEINNNYRYSTLGTGIYMTNNSVLNMYNGKISNNEARNNSVVKTNSEYTNDEKEKGIYQTCTGVGICATVNSEVNLLGGEISGNSAKNYAKTIVTTSQNNSIDTNIYSITDGIYGVGIEVEASTLRVYNNFKIFNNIAELNSNITLEENTIINNVVNCAVRGLQGYINNSNLFIDGAVISGGSFTDNIQINNNGKIINRETTHDIEDAGKVQRSSDRNNSISVNNVGGGLDLISGTTFDIKKLTVENCNSDNGAGVYIQSSKGVISDSKIINNKANDAGGGIWINSNDVKINNTVLSGNESTYGGAIYVSGASSNTELNNVKIQNNKTTVGSGGGIYAYGTLRIFGKDTIISNNVAKTYGGGIMVKTKTILNAGEISNNIATLSAGGGIRVDGRLTVNGGVIKNNTANTTGGGIDYTDGSLFFNSGIVENNKSNNAANEIYPINNRSVDSIEPELEIGEIENSWTNSDVKVNISAYDDETNIKSVKIDNKEVLSSNGAYTYIASENGTHEVIAVDNAGNQARREFTVICIDKTPPVITGITEGAIYNSDVIINADDLLSGLKEIILKRNGTAIPYALGDKITSSGEYKFTAIDNLSNRIDIIFVIDRSLKNDDIVVTGMADGWKNYDQIINIAVKNDIQSMKINNNEVELIERKYDLVVKENGTYRIETIGLNDERIVKSVGISNIDKDKPCIYGVIDGNLYNEKIDINEVNLYVRDELSGVLSIKITKDGVEKQYDDTHIILSENGQYNISVLDKAGNENTMHFTIAIGNNGNDKDDGDNDDVGDIIEGEENNQWNNEGIREWHEIQENDKTIANTVIPHTGIIKMIICIILISLVPLYLLVKLISYRDVK